MSFIKNTVLAAAMTLSLSGTALASDYLTLNAGAFNALRPGQEHAFQYGLEYRFNEVKYGLRPIVGAFGTVDGAAYGYAGLNWDVAILPNQLYIVPNFAIGAFREGSGKDLGGPLEFRSGLELDYQLPNQHQVGVAINHISNASIYKHNSGEETLLATYSIPVGSIFRGW